MAFGKPGRPPEDRLQRQCEIYTLAGPRILRLGARLTMREAASAAHISVGGLYHYFPAKRILLLHGLQPETQEFVCRPFAQAHAALRQTSPPRYLDAFLEHQVDMALFVRPSVRAAFDLGFPTLSAAVAATVDHAAEEFGGLVAEFLPGAGRGELVRLARSVRRAVVGALLDPSISRGELRATLSALVRGTALSADLERVAGPPRRRSSISPSAAAAEGR